MFLLRRFQDLDDFISTQSADWTRSPYLERAEQTLVDAHHRTCIVKFTAVVGCAEQSHKLALGEKLVAVFYDLMSATDKVHVMLLQESGYHVWTECEADTSVVLTPARNILIGVRPQQIAEKSTIGNL